jgi:hypothetical protein
MLGLAAGRRRRRSDPVVAWVSRQDGVAGVSDHHVHDRVTLVLAQDARGLGVLVVHADDEVAPGGADVLVLDVRRPHGGLAGRVAALAAKRTPLLADRQGRVPALGHLVRVTHEALLIGLA